MKTVYTLFMITFCITIYSDDNNTDERTYYLVNSIVSNVQRENNDSSWTQTEEYKQELHDTIENMHKGLGPYLMLARMFKPFISPIVNKWAKLRNLPQTPLLRWAKSTVASEREDMHKHNKSFAQFETLVRHLGMFITDLSIQSQSIYNQCIEIAKHEGGYAYECIVENPRFVLKIPGFSIVEKLNLLNAERIIGLLRVLNSVLYANSI